MTFVALIFFITSNAVAVKKLAAIQYSRSNLLTYSFSMLSVYLIIDWYFYEKSINLFNGLIYSTINNVIFIFFILIVTFFILILTSFLPTNINQQKDITNNTVSNEAFIFGLSEGNEGPIWESKINIKDEKKTKSSWTIKNILQIERDHFQIIEYPLIIQFILIGGITLLSSNDLITIFLSIELQSYGLYILSTIYRNSEASTGAGLTYFLLGGLSSCIILLGLSFLYVSVGTTSMDSLYLVYNIILSNSFYNDITSINSFFSDISLFSLNYYQYSIQFSLVILSVGFLFKISAAPFHSWSPGVYDAIPTVTTTFVAIIPKISILILLFDLVYSTWYTTFNYTWTNILLFSSFLSLIIGSILGLTQFKIKRLYAYSTVSHVGFILLALSIHSVESIQAFFFYIIQYSLSNLNAFLILVSIGYSYIYYKKKTKSYESELSIHKTYKDALNVLSPIEYIDNLKGYFYLNPLLAISLSITLYSFIGVPPLVGFFAKQMILSSALDNGYVFMSLIAILTSVISAVYYLYIVKHMFFEKSKYNLNLSLKKIIDMQTNDMGILNGVSKSKYKNNSIDTTTLSNWLTGIISILSLTMLLFIFLYYEIYFLMNIVSILLVY